MRESEFAKERRPDSLGREESQEAINGGNARNDFRKGLVSIFIDNLNPCLDLVGLWGFFKLYGKVRDVFLASKKSSRRSVFGFVRFESIEEATKVVKMVNGMVVHGWPIRAQVAAFGWNSRRPLLPRRYNKHGEEKMLEAKERCDGESYQKVGFESKRSFMEVLSSNQKRSSWANEKVGEKVVEMSWNCQDNEVGWLSRCAVGTLKDFSSVFSVNNRLRTRGLSFSSMYLGDKSILWKFGSEFERDDFVKSRFLWDDKFDSMRKWSDSLNPKARLVWIECVGVPTRFWSKAFFNKVGRQVGEVVMVEEGTLLKKRLDRGWILVLIPLNRHCPDLIKVKVGSEFFTIKTSEFSSPADFSWPEKCLGLETVDSCRSDLQNQEELVQHLSVNHDLGMDRLVLGGKKSNVVAKSLAKDMLVSGGQKSEVLDKVSAKDRLVSRDKKSDSAFSHHVKLQGVNFSKCSQPLSDFYSHSKLKGEKLVGEKAVKHEKSTKLYNRSSLPLVKDKVAISNSTSFYESLDKGLFFNLKKFEGEHSCGLAQHGSRKFGPLNEPPSCDGLVSVKKFQTGHSGKGLGVNVFKVGSRKDDGKSFEPPKMKMASLPSRNSGCMSNEKSNEGKVSVHLKLPAHTLGKSSCLAVKSHVMKFRIRKRDFKLPQILEEEISRIIRIGVALGVDFDGKVVGMADIFLEAIRKRKLGGLRELKVQ